MDRLAAQLDQLFRDERLRSDFALICGLSCQERHFLARTARFWGLPTGAYIQSLIRCGGNPLMPRRPEA